MSDVALRRWSVAFVVVAVALSMLAVALPTWVLVTLAGLPGDDPGRAARAGAIALGWFVTPALFAVSATIGSVLLRRRVRRGPHGSAAGQFRA